MYFEGTDRDGDSDAYSDHEESEESDAFGLPRTGSFSPGGLSTTSTRPSPHSERSVDAELPGNKRSNNAAPTTAPKRRRRAPRVPKKVAEVVEDTTAASAARPDVSEAVMSRIKKALALGLHCGGNEAEKKHAMQRATRLLQQHGLSQADVKDLSDDSIESASGMVMVRLRDTFVRFPVWGRDVMGMAELMSNADSFHDCGDRELKTGYEITFYGLKTDALMGAHIFEVAYNAVIHLALQEMSGQGARAMLDYRQGMVSGLYKIVKADKKEREDALDAARAAAAARAARPAAADEPAAKPVLGQRDMNAAASAAPAPVQLNDDGAPWVKMKPEPSPQRSTKHSGGGKKRKGDVRASDRDNGAGQDFDDVGDDSQRSSGRGSAGSADDSTEAGGLVMQQLVLYNDKAKLACDTLRKKLDLREGRALKRQIKNYEAYWKGKKDASKVDLGAKRIYGKGASHGMASKEATAGAIVAV